ncbi:MAG: restriction endonuclease subunit S [Bacteroidales bacterium]|nr:restriction endonuclease subunit S [Bacteroidales bacterium]
MEESYPEIQQNALKSIRIPLPPLEKQQKIVDHITAIRQQAKALQEEGKTILEDAKKEVERMILGNE